MQKVSCPNCGAEGVFRSPALPSRVCDYCHTILVRSGGGIEQVGKAAVLPFDVSPIQVGTAGTYDGRDFSVVGRVRWGWTDGSWNEWMVLFGDGSEAWLGEAMGQFLMTLERPLGDVQGDPTIRAIILGEQVPIGAQAMIDGETFIVSDAREATCLAAEGELPFTALTGTKIYSVDLRSTTGAVASLQKEKTLSSFYQGRYLTLEEMRPRYLRAIEGWPVPAYGS